MGVFIGAHVESFPEDKFTHCNLNELFCVK